MQKSQSTSDWLFFWSGRPGSNWRHSRWQRDILPLNYSRIFNCPGMVGERRLELLRLAAPDPKSGVSAISPLARGRRSVLGTLRSISQRFFVCQPGSPISEFYPPVLCYPRRRRNSTLRSASFSRRWVAELDRSRIRRRDTWPTGMSRSIDSAADLTNPSFWLA